MIFDRCERNMKDSTRCRGKTNLCLVWFAVIALLCFSYSYYGSVHGCLVDPIPSRMAVARRRASPVLVAPLTSAIRRMDSREIGLFMPCHRRMCMRLKDMSSTVNDDDSKDKSSSGDEGNTGGATKAQLTVPQIAELIDVSFVQACMQLAQGYVDVLKLMIATLQSAYEQGVSPACLIQEIDRITQPAAGRQLMPEEVKLRNTWIQVEYIMLRAFGSSSKTQDQSTPPVVFELDPDILACYGKIAPILIRRRALSDEFNGTELLAVTRQIVRGDDDKDASMSPLEEALLLQNLRVMWLTMTVVEEVERCEGEFARMDAKMPPKPPIPGAFE